MNIEKYFHLSIICIFLISCGTAQSQSIKISRNDKQRLPIENLNLSGSDFIKAYMSKDISQRRLAEMYLIGVLDSTEGKTWCGYGVALPGSIQEQVYIGFKNEPPESMEHRASEIIKSFLKNKLPCKDRE